MSELDELLRGRVAYGAMTAILRSLTSQLRSNGEPIPDWGKPVLEALSVAAGVPLPPSVVSVIGRPVGRVDVTNWLTVQAAAELVKRTDRHVRRLALSGQVRARRVGGRVWLVDLDSLRGVLERSNGQGD